MENDGGRTRRDCERARPAPASPPRQVLRASHVIASGRHIAERSSPVRGPLRLDCFAASRLAMTTPASSLRASGPSLRAGGTLPSEAVQCEGLSV
ncbi:MAG: hypothetical protein LBT00_08040 [Spirochaetaceae bacterium]|nr:hypothetical protein [Spirochaetaceae bacterium]